MEGEMEGGGLRGGGIKPHDKWGKREEGMGQREREYETGGRKLGRQNKINKGRKCSGEIKK